AAVGAVRLLEVMKPWFLLPLVGWSMVYATNLMLTFFLALVLKEQGIREDIIGLLIAAAAVSEVIVFFAMARFAKRFTARSLILFSAVVAVVRWVGMALSPSVEWLFVL